MNKPSFVISCPIDTYSGYGARARDIVKAIINTGRYDVKILPQRWGDTPGNFLQDNKEWDFLLPFITPQLTAQPDIWMQITIPSEFSPQGKYNIGCTAGIESTGCDPEWVEGLNRMDMNWVSSNHSKQVFSSITYEKRDKNTNQPLGVTKLQKPMEVVFEGVDLNVYKHIPNENVTLNLDAIKESFCYLFVGHWMQGSLGHDRKNVGLTIKYFFDAFKNQKSAPALILKVSTGWPQMDRLLYGGFSRGELNIFAGGSGSGKSLVMMNIALNWLQQGLSGVYITLELSEELTSLRTDAMLTQTSTKDIRKDIDTTTMKVLLVGKKSGNYQVKGLPAQSNINDIRAYLKEYQIQTGKKVDFVMIDYLDLLMPVSAKVSPNDLLRFSASAPFLSRSLSGRSLSSLCINSSTNFNLSSFASVSKDV